MRFAFLAVTLALFTSMDAGAAPLLVHRGTETRGLGSSDDTDCVPGYVNLDEHFVAVGYERGPASVMDDLHLPVTGNVAICSFTIRGLAFYSGRPGTVAIQFRSGGADDPTPGPVTAGPFFLHYEEGTEAIDYIVETPSGYLTPNTYMEVIWEGENEFFVALATTPALGTSHDVFYILPDEMFFDAGPWPANFWTEVRVGPSVPTQAPTWGALKATYR